MLVVMNVFLIWKISYKRFVATVFWCNQQKHRRKSTEQTPGHFLPWDKLKFNIWSTLMYFDIWIIPLNHLNNPLSTYGLIAVYKLLLTDLTITTYQWRSWLEKLQICTQNNRDDAWWRNRGYKAIYSASSVTVICI